MRTRILLCEFVRNDCNPVFLYSEITISQPPYPRRPRSSFLVPHSSFLIPHSVGSSFFIEAWKRKRRGLLCRWEGNVGVDGSLAAEEIRTRAEFRGTWMREEESMADLSLRANSGRGAGAGAMVLVYPLWRRNLTIWTLTIPAMCVMVCVVGAKVYGLALFHDYIHNVYASCFAGPDRTHGAGEEGVLGEEVHGEGIHGVRPRSVGGVGGVGGAGLATVLGAKPSGAESSTGATGDLPFGTFDDTTPCPVWLFTVLKYLPGVVCGLGIRQLKRLFTRVTTHLNDLENHRTTGEHQRNLVAKVNTHILTYSSSPVAL